MYPLAHLYFAEKVFAFLDDAIVLGSIFPDMAILSGIDWNSSHSLGLELWEHFKQADSNLVNFPLGVISHGIEPKGLDYYSDEKYGDFTKGYCFEKAKPLIAEVVEACYISSRDGWWKAHNFVEMGVELYIYEKRPQLLMTLQKTFNNVVLIKQLCNKLSTVLNKEQALLEKAFAAFSRFIKDEPLDAQHLALRYQRQIYFRHNIDSINLIKCQGIIKKAKELIIEDIEDFFYEVKMLMYPLWQEIKK